jgi:hypothetical protein
MRTLFTLAVLLTLTTTATAQNLGSRAPAKVPQSYPENIPDPVRQGGDTVANATVIYSVPYNDSGTTVGYTNDYDEACPYPGATAPDVVYKYVANSTFHANIDLCGSAYDTKVYIYDGGLNLIACNDDFYFGAPCGMYVSKIENAQLVAGTTYYIVIDGYGAASGAYEFDFMGFMDPCYQPFPDTEGEPPLVDGYVDTYNGGCNTPPDFPFQAIVGDANGDAFLGGESGWYTVDGASHRDTDWFVLTMGPQGTIEVTACAMGVTYIFELGPQDCGAVGVIQLASTNYWEEGSLTISGYDHLAPVWFWVGPDTFSPPDWPDTPYGYNIWFSGLEPGVVTTEATTWSRVKALYD